MLVRGDKIKLVKEINGFDKIGEIFEVYEILEGGAISFRCWFGTGLMSYDEFEKHFEKTRILKWGDWIPIHRDGLDCYYRTNGKRVEVKSYNFRASASCHESDEFDLEKGVKLCVARLKVKKILSEM